MKNGKKDGDVIPNHYPAAITEEEWLAARHGRQQRTKTRGRRGKHVNIFAGILASALDRGPYHLTSWRLSGGRKQMALLNFKSVEGLAKAASFPYEPLETAVLSKLRELDLNESTGRAIPMGRMTSRCSLGNRSRSMLPNWRPRTPTLEVNAVAARVSPTGLGYLRRRNRPRQQGHRCRQKATCPATEALGGGENPCRSASHRVRPGTISGFASKQPSGGSSPRGG